MSQKYEEEICTVTNPCFYKTEGTRKNEIFIQHARAKHYQKRHITCDAIQVFRSLYEESIGFSKNKCIDFYKIFQFSFITRKEQ